MEVSRKLIILIDFDGTCVKHEYPLIGADIGAIPVLQDLVAAGHQLILHTMRSGKELEHALDWFKGNNIPLWSVNLNIQQMQWTKSPKIYAHLYIDDAALGCPLIYPEIGKPYVDWDAVLVYLLEKGILRG